MELTSTRTYENSMIVFTLWSFLLHDLNCLFLLQEVEAKYNNLIRQRPERSAADTDGNKGISIMLSVNI